jgi:hypothetical protein
MQINLTLFTDILEAKVTAAMTTFACHLATQSFPASESTISPVRPNAFWILCAWQILATTSCFASGHEAQIRAWPLMLLPSKFPKIHGDEPVALV